MQKFITLKSGLLDGHCWGVMKSGVLTRSQATVSLESEKEKKTVNQVVYREEMCPQMFEDIDQVMQGEPWTWQQDGAKPHTANDTVAWLRVNTPDFITPQQCNGLLHLE